MRPVRVSSSSLENEILAADWSYHFQPPQAGSLTTTVDRTNKKRLEMQSYGDIRVASITFISNLFKSNILKSAL